MSVVVGDVFAVCGDREASLYVHEACTHRACSGGGGAQDDVLYRKLLLGL